VGWASVGKGRKGEIEELGLGKDFGLNRFFWVLDLVLILGVQKEFKSKFKFDSNQI